MHMFITSVLPGTMSALKLFIGGSLTQCPACNNPLRYPKRLPCLHTFCRDCLDDQLRSTPAWRPTVCRLCATPFAVPTGSGGGGLDALPDNAFAATLVQLNRLLAGPSPDLRCDACAGDAGTEGGGYDDATSPTAAAIYCADCDQKLCDACSTAHRKLRATRSHRVFALGTRECDQIKIIWRDERPPKCAGHPDASAAYYCARCAVGVCRQCAAAVAHEHGDQRPQPVTAKLVTECRAKIHEDALAIGESIASWHLAEQNLQDEKKQFIENVHASAAAVEEHARELVRLVGVQKDELIQRLEKVKRDASDDFDAAGDEVDRTLAKMEGFRQFAEEIAKHGGVSDIFGLFVELRTRARQLHEITTQKKAQLVKITFIPAYNQHHLVGQVSVDLKNKPPLNNVL